MEEPIKLLSINQVAELLDMSTGTLRNWISKGEKLGANFHKVGDKQMITVVDFNNYVKGD